MKMAIIAVMLVGFSGIGIAAENEMTAKTSNLPKAPPHKVTRYVYNSWHYSDITADNGAVVTLAYRQVAPPPFETAGLWVKLFKQGLTGKENVQVRLWGYLCGYSGRMMDTKYNLRLTYQKDTDGVMKFVAPVYDFPLTYKEGANKCNVYYKAAAVINDEWLQDPKTNSHDFYVNLEY